jgi:hypothetical protein
VPAEAGQTGRDRDRHEVRQEASRQSDPKARDPHEGRKPPTDDEKLRFGDAAPGVAPVDETILPDRGNPVPESLQRDATNHGVLDPAESGHPLPEGLERKPAAPLNKDTGRKIKRGA